MDREARASGRGGRRRVVGVDVQHARRERRRGRGGRARPGSAPTQPEAVEVRVDRDDVDLAEDRLWSSWTLVQQNAGETAVAFVEEETVGVEPRLVLAGRAGCLESSPPARDGGEGAVVDLQPGLLVLARRRRRGDDAGIIARRERSPHLEQPPAGGEPDLGGRSSWIASARTPTSGRGRRPRRRPARRPLPAARGRSRPSRSGGAGGRPPRAPTSCCPARPGRSRPDGRAPGSQATRPAKPARPPCTRSNHGGRPTAGDRRPARPRPAAPDLGDVVGRHLRLISQARSIGGRVAPAAADDPSRPQPVPPAHGRRERRRAAPASVAHLLAEEYPEALCELDHRNPFQLLAATILSAQTTDARVNMVTPALFARYPDAEALAGADPAELEEIVRSTGFYHNKSRSLLGMAQALVERFGGEVPTAPGGSGHPAGRRAQDRQRGAQRGLRAPRAAGRHPRRSAQPPPGADHEEDPVKVELVLNSLPPAGRAGPVQPPHDPPRPAGLPRPLAEVRRLRPGRHLSFVTV